MSSKSKRNGKFIAEHPLCCFCGGNTPAVEKEHLPSRACFDRKSYPEGFEFPTCRACNASSSADEQVVALFSRSLSNPNAAALPDEIGKYMAGVANNSADVFAELGRAARRLDANHGLFEIGEVTQEAFRRVLKRWAKAFHYKETRSIVPANGRIHISWFSNANVDDIPPGAFEGRVHILRRNGKNIGDQFAYITKNDPARPDLGYYTAAFRRSFLAVLLVDFHGEIIRE